MFWGKSIFPTFAVDHRMPVLPTTPPSGGPTESRLISPAVKADTRARAYEMAKAECAPGSSRAEVMIAADEIFAYVMHGRKPIKDD